MEEALVTLLLSDAALVALTGTRINWGRRPQDNSTVPAIALHRITGTRDYTMAGPSGLVESRVQADVYAGTYSAAKLTARALISAINGYDEAVSGVDFQRISVEGERDTNETESGGRYLYRCSIDLNIWHDE
ncbi:MAG TPA: hypothetical protein DCG72_03710 [Gammaproteobacteria bacterium]|nr:hypothetical protein [Gammaproteobacteria bacterium]